MNSNPHGMAPWHGAGGPPQGGGGWFGGPYGGYNPPGPPGPPYSGPPGPPQQGWNGYGGPGGYGPGPGQYGGYVSKHLILFLILCVFHLINTQVLFVMVFEEIEINILH